MTSPLNYHQPSPCKAARTCGSEDANSALPFVSHDSGNDDLPYISQDTNYIRPCVSMNANYTLPFVSQDPNYAMPCVSNSTIKDTHGGGYLPTEFVPKIIMTVLLILAMMAGFAQESWQRISPLPQEQTLNAVTTIPGTSTLVAVGEGSAIMFSYDNALSWDIIHNPAGMNNDFDCKLVQFLDSEIGFVVGDKCTILKTIDGGDSWAETSMENEDITIIDMAFVDENVGFAVTYEGVILKTVDAGDSWVVFESEMFDNLTTIIILSDNRMIVSALYNYIYISDDLGESWEEVTVMQESAWQISGIECSSGDVLHISLCLYEGLNCTTVFGISNDSGETWSILDNNSLCSLDAEIAFIDDQQGIMALEYYFVGFAVKLYRTDDGGMTWSEYESYIPDYKINSICSFGDSKFLLAGRNGKMFQYDVSTDILESLSTFELPETVHKCQFFAEETGYCLAKHETSDYSSFNTLFTSHDMGLTWENELDFNRIESDNCMSFSSADTGNIIFTDGFNYTILTTDDGGESWFYNVYTADFLSSTSILRFMNSQKGYMGCEFGIYETHDRGESWDYVQGIDDISDYGIRDIEFLGEDYVYFAGKRRGYSTFLKSVNGGLDWSQTGLDSYQEVHDLVVLSESIFLVALGSEIKKTTDGGDSWYAVEINSDTLIQANEMCFPTADIGYAVCSGAMDNMLKTYDGGESWESLNTNVTANLTTVHFFDENHGIVMGENGIILRTDNGGTTFIEEQPAIPEEPSAITLFPNPVTDILNITFEDPQQRGELIFYSTNGIEVLRRKHNANVAGIIMNVQTMDAGAYVVHYVVDGNIIETTKIVIQ